MNPLVRLLVTTSALVVLAACVPSEQAFPGDRLEVVSGVEYYPACGNELLVWEGVTYYPFDPEDDADFPDPVAMPGGVGGQPGAVARVVAPGPGDDVGALVIYANGYAFFRSDSGDLTTWLTTQPREYDWVC
jgi:hypothetical protein